MALLIVCQLVVGVPGLIDGLFPFVAAFRLCRDLINFFDSLPRCQLIVGILRALKLFFRRIGNHVLLRSGQIVKRVLCILNLLFALFCVCHRNCNLVNQIFNFCRRSLIHAPVLAVHPLLF